MLWRWVLFIGVVVRRGRRARDHARFVAATENAQLASAVVRWYEVSFREDSNVETVAVLWADPEPRAGYYDRNTLNAVRSTVAWYEAEGVTR